jgi:hypothetical protein
MIYISSLEISKIQFESLIDEIKKIKIKYLKISKIDFDFLKKYKDIILKLGPVNLYYDLILNSNSKSNFKLDLTEFEKDKIINRISEDSTYSFFLALNYFNRPWHEEEKIDKKIIERAHLSIINSSNDAYDYARDVLGGPWSDQTEIDEKIRLDAELNISKGLYAIDYAILVLKKPWSKTFLSPKESFEVERESLRPLQFLGQLDENYVINKIISYLNLYKTNEKEYNFIKDDNISKEFKKEILESFFNNDAFLQFFTSRILKDNWRKYENIIQDISNDPKIIDKIEGYFSLDSSKAYYYAYNFLKSPWHKYTYLNKKINSEIIKTAEENISSDAQISFNYAKLLLKKPWHEEEEIDPKIRESAENSILNYGPRLCVEYAIDVIKGRWEIAEPIIMSSENTSKKYIKEILKQ